VIGPALRELFAQRPLHGPVCVGHRRAVGLDRDREVTGTEARQGDRGGDIGQLKGKLQVGVHLRESEASLAITSTTARGP